MSYSVRIEVIGADGRSLGRPAIETVVSKSEAIAVMRKAIQLGSTSTQSMQFSVYGPGDQLLLSYSSNMAVQLHAVMASA